jgi:hypothetical protein
LESHLLMRLRSLARKAPFILDRHSSPDHIHPHHDHQGSMTDSVDVHSCSDSDLDEVIRLRVEDFIRRSQENDMKNENENKGKSKSKNEEGNENKRTRARTRRETRTRTRTRARSKIRARARARARARITRTRTRTRTRRNVDGLVFPSNHPMRNFSMTPLSSSSKISASSLACKAMQETGTGRRFRRARTANICFTHQKRTITTTYGAVPISRSLGQDER